MSVAVAGPVAVAEPVFGSTGPVILPMVLVTAANRDHGVGIFPHRRQAPIAGVMAQVLGSCAIDAIDEIVVGRLPKSGNSLFTCHAGYFLSAITSKLMSSPSPFPTSCRPTPLVPPFFTRPTTFTEDSHPAYFFFSSIGYAAFHESGNLCAAFRRKYPLALRSQLTHTPEFESDRARHLGSLAAIYAVAGIRDLIVENALKAARADVDAVLELMTEAFVGAWGPSVSRAHRFRREQAVLREGRRRQREAFYAARAAAVAPSLSPQPLDPPAQWDPVPDGWGTGNVGWGSGSGWGSPTATNHGWATGGSQNGWGWGWGQDHRRRQPAPTVGPLRAWSEHPGRTARPSTRTHCYRYAQRRRRRARAPTWHAVVRRFTALLARIGRRILARGLVQ
ncbi:hypothetical protein C8F04DRAFT_1193564 [Mycena alexandri]|uniref:Uncharacterized protein n=1 Tax=Mycena alexandri TaxID=1745969 RepID=A0AAD6S8R8_9AGAR|nr:hypothetical protein C8F04DRAFT_1193564 [Mycena alexandri]